MSRRVGLLTTSYPRAAGDWAGGFVATRARALAAAGAAVEVIAAGPPGDPGDPGITVVRVPAPRGLFYVGGAPEALAAGGWPAALAFAARLLAAAAAREGRWDALESHWLVPGGIVGAALARGRPHRMQAHGGDLALLERLPAGDAIARALARSPGELVFASADLQARFVRLAGLVPPSSAVEPAPIDARLFTPATAGDRAEARRSLGLAGAVVLAVGRLVPIKGHDLLLRAVAGLPPPRPRVVVLGEGPERARLRALAAALGVELALPGAQPPPAVARWMAAADLLVQPSRAGSRVEGSPLAPREARARGLPVVVAASGGLAELDGVVVVPPDDVPVLRSALCAAFAAQHPTHQPPWRCEHPVTDAPPPSR